MAFGILQSKWIRRLVYVTQHLGEEGLVLLAGHAQARLRHEISVLERLWQVL